MICNKRLRSIIDEINNAHTLADIGCDHGKVSVMCLLEKRAQYVIACDISAPSLQKAEKLAKKYNLTNIDFRCGDGMDVIKDNEVDTLLIAGMGGYEIIKILSRKKTGINQYVLCAHNNVLKLRQFLVENCIKIDKDYVVESENHFYNIIVAKDGNQELSDKELLLGQDSFDNLDYYNFLLYLKDKNQRILDRKIDDKRKSEVLKDLSIIEKELNEGSLHN